MTLAGMWAWVPRGVGGGFRVGRCQLPADSGVVPVGCGCGLCGLWGWVAWGVAKFVFLHTMERKGWV